MLKIVIEFIKSYNAEAKGFLNIMGCNFIEAVLFIEDIKDIGKSYTDFLFSLL